jgi:uncharacterized SAM-binding protein YcdF (DUF218 family)
MAGIFGDRAGGWWPTENSVLRVATARRLQHETGLPLILSGGSLGPGEPAEAEVAAAATGLSSQDAKLESTARDTAQTGRTVSEILKTGFAPNGEADFVPRAVIVTHSYHILRTAAVLRRHGITVSAIPVSREQEFGPVIGLFLPQREGLLSANAALHEYVGLIWYLARGDIRVRDLFGD